jgi:hypothetical protein
MIYRNPRRSASALSGATEGRKQRVTARTAKEILLAVVRSVHFHRGLQRIRKFFEREDSISRAYRNAGTAINTIVGANVKLFGFLEPLFIFAGMNAVNRTDVYTQGIFSARFSNHIGHGGISP